MTELAKMLNVNNSSIRTAKSTKRILNGTYYFSNNLEELQEFSKNKHITSFNQENEYLIEYYEYLKTLDNPTINQVAEALNLTRDTLNKRNKKLREMGYTLPFNSHNKIKYVELIDMINHTMVNMTIDDIAIKFNITKKSARKQIHQDSLYKKRYKFNIVYV